MNPYAPTPQPPQKSWPGRHKIITGIGVLAGLIVVLTVIAAVAAPKPKPLAVARPATPAAAVTTPPTWTPPPAPNPQGSISTGSGFGCDVSLSDSVYGQNYLTAQVTAQNTGNIGIYVRIRVSWPLQGWPPIVRHKTVRVPAGQSVSAEFHVPVTDSQVSDFQNAQMAATGDPCSYHGSITGTYGSVNGA